MLKVGNKRFNRDWLKSVTLKTAISICTDTKSEVVTEAWNIAHGITDKPIEAPKRNTRKK